MLMLVATMVTVLLLVASSLFRLELQSVSHVFHKQYAVALLLQYPARVSRIRIVTTRHIAASRTNNMNYDRQCYRVFQKKYYKVLTTSRLLASDRPAAAHGGPMLPPCGSFRWEIGLGGPLGIQTLSIRSFLREPRSTVQKGPL